MNRIAITVLMLTACLSIYAQGPAGRSCNSVDPPVSHWSADVRFGPGYTASNGFDLNAGGSVEYSINPFAGIGLKALYGIRFDVLDVLGYSSLNLSNLTTPFRTGNWKRTNIFAVAGLGLHQAGSPSMLVMAGLNGEYNINDSWAFEMGGDLLYGLDKGVNVSVGMRYKFGVLDKKHALNISMNEYRLQPSPIVIRRTVWVNASVERLEVLERSNDSLQVSLLAAEDAIKSYKELLASQEAARVATKAVGKPSKPVVSVTMPVAVAPPVPSAITVVPIADTSASAAITTPVIATAVSADGTVVIANAAAVSANAAKASVLTSSSPPQLKVANVVTGTLNPVEFLSGYSQLTPNSKLILDEMAVILQTKEWKSLTIIGNTDNQGYASNNKVLSLKRAVIVRDYLVSRGLPLKKLKVRGDGGLNPIDSNKTPLGRRLNRRIDFVLEQ